MSTDIVFLSDDLMFAPRVSGQARAAGWQLREAGSPSAALALVEAESPRLLIVDLETSGLDIAELISQLDQATRPSVLAFGPHVHLARLESAREAGCDQVVSRGRFSSDLASLLGDCLDGEDS
jgi:CheY-like chemotaxis protein